MSVTSKSLPAGGLIFSTLLSEVSGKRFDPIANQEKRRQFERSIRSSIYPVYSLRKVVDVRKSTVNEISEGESYIGLENIDGESGQYIGTTDKESVSSAIQFSAGQVLFPKLRPYLNKTHLAAFSGVCSTEFHVFTPHKVSSGYLAVVLRSHSIVGITSLLMTGNTLPRLQMSDIEQLPIPIPPTHIQEKVVDAWRTALHQRVQRIDEARSLLATIDDVLLDELGIPRQPEPPNTLESRIFTTRFCELTEQRFDSLFYQTDIFGFVRKAKCGLQRLGSAVNYFVTGFAAGRDDQADEDEGGIIQIRPTNLSDDRELVFKRNVHIAASELKTRKADVLKPREVLFNNTNSQEQVGKTVWFDLEGDYFSSNHITRIGRNRTNSIPNTSPISSTFISGARFSSSSAPIGTTNLVLEPTSFSASPFRCQNQHANRKS